MSESNQEVPLDFQSYQFFCKDAQVVLNLVNKVAAIIASGTFSIDGKVFVGNLLWDQIEQPSGTKTHTLTTGLQEDFEVYAENTKIQANKILTLQAEEAFRFLSRGQRIGAFNHLGQFLIGFPDETTDKPEKLQVRGGIVVDIVKSDELNTQKLVASKIQTDGILEIDSDQMVLPAKIQLKGTPSSNSSVPILLSIDEDGTIVYKEVVGENIAVSLDQNQIVLSLKQNVDPDADVLFHNVQTENLHVDNLIEAKEVHGEKLVTTELVCATLKIDDLVVKTLSISDSFQCENLTCFQVNATNGTFAQSSIGKLFAGSSTITNIDSNAIQTISIASNVIRGSSNNIPLSISNLNSPIVFENCSETQFRVPITLANIPSNSSMLGLDQNKQIVAKTIQSVPNQTTVSATDSGFIVGTAQNISPSSNVVFASVNTSSISCTSMSVTSINSTSINSTALSTNRITLPQTHAARKVQLFRLADNDQQYMGFGTANNELRIQIDNPSSDVVFYAGNDSVTSREIARIRGTGIGFIERQSRVSQLIPLSQDTRCTFNLIVSNTFSSLAASCTETRFTAFKPMTISVVCSISTQGSGKFTGMLHGWIRKNNAGPYYGYNAHPANNQQIILNVSANIRLAAGDYIEWICWQDASTSLAIGGPQVFQICSLTIAELVSTN